MSDFCYINESHTHFPAINVSWNWTFLNDRRIFIKCFNVQCVRCSIVQDSFLVVFSYFICIFLCKCHLPVSLFILKSHSSKVDLVGQTDWNLTLWMPCLMFTDDKYIYRITISLKFFPFFISWQIVCSHWQTLYVCVFSAQKWFGLNFRRLKNCFDLKMPNKPFEPPLIIPNITRESITYMFLLIVYYY